MAQTEEREALERAPQPPVRHHGPTAKEYVRVFLILCVLTGIEVWLSYSGLPHGLMITMLWVAAVIKFSMVVSYFMHLKYDDRRYSRFFVMGLAGAGTLYLIVLLIAKVFAD
jgi:cytochrome c oxidase subunit IV